MSLSATRTVLCLTLGLFAALMTGHPARADDMAVTVENRSEPEICAEKDNVALNFRAAGVKSFRIQAVHPAFIGTIVADRWAPDFTKCDMRHDTAFGAKARRVTFYETPDFWLTGYTYPSFWRPGSVPVKVGDRVEEGLHIIQVWVRFQERAEEVLVLYPPDGYWRARPLPPPHMRWSAYGSSFLVGPVTVKDRPLVELKSIAFEPETRTFVLDFLEGGSARVTLAALDQDRIVLDTTFDTPTTDRAPFFAMRSMYVTEYNSDVSRVAWRAPGDKGWGEAPIMTWPGGRASEVWAGRLLPSRHNTSAPDTILENFAEE